MASGWALLCVRADGSTRSTHPIVAEVTELGRDARDLSFPDDVYMAGHHASLVFETGEPFIADTAESTGVWLRVQDPHGVELEPQSQVCLGSQILLTDRRSGHWQLEHYVDGAVRGLHRIPEPGLEVGRDAELSLDAGDEALSRRRARFFCRDGKLLLFDDGSRNGTFVKVRGAAPLCEGDEFRIETRSFRLVRTQEA
jgi:pSer/pThr/pTyr-binding forkhead associated (FHA) protein